MSLITTEARLITLIASNYKNSIEQNILDSLLLLISPLELPTSSAVENAEDFKLKSVVLMWQSIRMAIDWTRAVISSFCDLYMLPNGLANKHFQSRHQELKSPIFDRIIELFSGDDADDKIERINRLIGCILADRINHLTILESQLCKLSIEHPQVIEVNLVIQTEDSTSSSSSNVDSSSSSSSSSLPLSTQIINQTMDASQISQVIKKTVGGGGKKNKSNAPLTPTDMMQYLNNYLHPLSPSVSAVLGYRAFPLAYSQQDLYDVFKVLSPHSNHSNGVHETSIRHKKVNFQFSSVCNLLVYTSNKADSLHKQIHLTNNDQGIFDYLTKMGQSANHESNQEIPNHHHIESGLESFPCYMQFLYESRCFIIINKLLVGINNFANESVGQTTHSNSNHDVENNTDVSDTFTVDVEDLEEIEPVATAAINV